MPYVQANNIELYYEVTGEGDPLVLIPYTAADQACYAFQVADYAKRFTCYTVDLRAALFADPRFVVQGVGPFVLAIRRPVAQPVTSG